MIFCASIIRSARTRRCSASSRRNPKSRNTLPVDGVTLSFLVNSPSHQSLHASLSDQSPEPLSGQLHVATPRLSCALFERVQHIDGLPEFGNVQYPMLKGCVNPNFTDTRSDRRHGLPVEGVETLLDTPKLHTGKTPGVPRKRAHIAARGTEP